MTTLNVSSDVYSIENIQKSITAYQNLAEILLEKNENRWIIIFKNCQYEESLTIKEFENYLIGLENS